jgi:hypothetical protein
MSGMWCGVLNWGWEMPYNPLYIGFWFPKRKTKVFSLIELE